MTTFKHINAESTRSLLDAGDATLVDIRDPQSFAAGHIPGARHLDNNNLPDFLAEADPDRAVVVCCYHGNSSQGAAAFLVERGFEEVYSLDGGIEGWKGAAYPVTTAP